jgi:hypothetical protein
MSGGIASTAARVNVVPAMLYYAVGTELPPYLYHVSDPATVEGRTSSYSSSEDAGHRFIIAPWPCKSSSVSNVGEIQCP